MSSLKNKIFSKISLIFRVRNFFSFLKRKKDLSAHDQELVYSLSRQKIPRPKQLKYVFKFLNKKESLIFFLGILLLVIGLSWWLVIFVKKHLEITPVVGGSYREALVGKVQAVNPLYSLNRDVDADISALVYSSLFKRDLNGQMSPDIVKEFSVDNSGKVYNLVLREDVFFHHGEKLTAEDVLFTFEAINNLEYHSSWRDSFLGVTLEKTGDYSLRFTLAEAYGGFLELLNFGILPANLWSGIEPSNAFLNDLSLKPIGSGPYKFNYLTKGSVRNIKEYSLERNSNYYGGPVYIDEIVFSFFNTTDEALEALNGGEVDGLAYLPLGQATKLVAKNSYNFRLLSWPQTTALFYNSTASKSLGEKKFRQAISEAIDRESILENILNGYGEITEGPWPAQTWAYNSELPVLAYRPNESLATIQGYGWKPLEISAREAEALSKGEFEGLENSEIKKEIFELAQSLDIESNGFWHYQDPASAGAEKRYLYLTISIIDSENYWSLAEEIKKSWEKIGIRVAIKSYPSYRINEIIKGRSYQVLLISQLAGGDLDLYHFWHSSQARTGYNLSDYKNKAVDELLLSSRNSNKLEDKKENYKKIQENINQDFPATFLFSPDFLYLQNKKVKGFKTEFISAPAERFSEVNSWYIKTKKRLLWKK